MQVARRAIGASPVSSARSSARTPLSGHAARRSNAPAARRASGSRVAAAPAFVPAAPYVDITEPAARALIDNLQRVSLVVETIEGKPAVDTAFVGPSPEQLAKDYPADAPIFVLLHGFDSSVAEWRRTYPLLAQHAPTYAVDLVGEGFTDSSLFLSPPAPPIRPADKSAHLRAFLAHVLGGPHGSAGRSARPVVLVGASLGGAVALEFAHTYPEDVEKLVLIDAQGFVDGLGSMSQQPRWLLRLGVELLRSVPLRQAANQMAYHDKKRLANEDAMRVGRLHTHLPGWADAQISFMKGGGYAISKKIPETRQEVLVMWGRNDEILPTANADKFVAALPRCAGLVWVEACGHVSHLEQPTLTADTVLSFAGVTAAGAVGETQAAAVAAVAGGR